MRKIHNWKLSRSQLTLGKRTAVMGILNVTPDSFSDGGMYFDPAQAVERALQLEAAGADIIDVGGESSRPGSVAVLEDEEVRRVIPVIESLAGRVRVPLSIDTYRSGVARRALEAGAQIINDISAFRFDPEMTGVAVEHGCGVVLMHSRGSRDELHKQPPMADAVSEVIASLKQSAGAAVHEGVAPSAIVVDPGIGFGKRAEDSMEVLRNLEMFSRLEYPLLVGTSRKSFLSRIVHDGPDGRLWGTAASVAASVFRGTHIVRVHDVGSMRVFVDVLDTLV